MSATITTQRFVCGPYVFAAHLPALGRSDDVEMWSAIVDGEELPARFSSLEGAMQAAIDKMCGLRS